MGLNRKNLTKDELSVYKTIQATNKRLYNAISTYGRDSAVVVEMLDRINYISGLELTKSGYISETKNAIDKIISMQNNNTNRVDKFVVERLKSANVDRVLNALEFKYTGKTTTGTKKERAKNVEMLVKKYAWKDELIREIYFEIYKTFGKGSEESDIFTKFLNTSEEKEVVKELTNYETHKNVKRLIDEIRNILNARKSQYDVSITVSPEQLKELGFDEE